MLMGTGALCGDELDMQEQRYLAILQSAATFEMQEQRYLAILQSAATFEMSRNQLIIRDATGQEVLRFD
jgi:heat shock protein HslJ